MKPDQMEHRPTPNQELEELEQELREKGYVVKTKTERGQKVDVTLKNALGQEGSGEGYTYEIALKRAISSLDYISQTE